jgi:hypothetical protein
LKIAGRNSQNEWMSLEVFLLGGASILMCLATWAFSDRTASVATVGKLVFGLSFVVNYPHFLSSYVLIYKDFRNGIFTNFRYFLAAVIVPFVLISLLGYAIFNEQVPLMGHLISIMFFLVGWHYVKQIFGCIIVSSVRRSIFYKPFERGVILLNLYSLWGISFLGPQLKPSTFQFYGIKYSSLELPPILLTLAYGLCALSGIIVVALHVRKYIVENVTPSPGAVVALATLYVWYLPMFSHPMYAYSIPFFHSLQYLALAWVFKWNQVEDQVSSLKGRDQRKKWVLGFLGFILSVTVLGAIFFEFLPNFLDQLGLVKDPAMGTAPILAAFLLFINIHHYFIDNVIWRSTNTDVKKHLLLIPTNS